MSVSYTHLDVYKRQQPLHSTYLRFSHPVTGEKLEFLSLIHIFSSLSWTLPCPSYSLMGASSLPPRSDRSAHLPRRGLFPSRAPASRRSTRGFRIRGCRPVSYTHLPKKFCHFVTSVQLFTSFVPLMSHIFSRINPLYLHIRCRHRELRDSFHIVIVVIVFILQILLSLIHISNPLDRRHVRQNLRS